jgi:hypothetical protein
MRYACQLVMFLFLLFLPYNANADCDSTCRDLYPDTSNCGTCQPQGITTCSLGCTCGSCTQSYGQCNCNNKLFGYTTDGIAGDSGACECGDARVHVRRSSSARISSATSRMAFKAVDAPDGMKENAPENLVSEKVILVPNKCTHGYVVFRPKTSAVVFAPKISAAPGGN